MLRLKHLIRERKLTQAEAGRLSGVHPVTVGLIANGRLIPYAAQLAKLAKALGWPEEHTAELLEECDEQ